MMKYLLIFLSLIIILSSCGEKRSGGYTIEGNIRNLDSGWVYLQVMATDSIEHPHWSYIDSARCGKGRFVLHSDSSLKEPEWGAALDYKADTSLHKKRLTFFNHFTNSRYGNFVLENGNIVIKGDMTDKKGLLISGSPETSFDFQYGLMNAPFRKLAVLDTLIDKIDSLQSKGNDRDNAQVFYLRRGLENLNTTHSKTGDSLIVKLIDQYHDERDSILRPYKDHFKTIIRHYPGRYMALFNIYNMAGYFSSSELMTMYLSMNTTIQESPTGKKLRNYIQQSMRLQHGKHFPDFNYRDTSGKQFNLADIMGEKGTLIVFWASWCGPCRKEIPQLKALYRQYHSQGLSIVSISMDDNANWWKGAVEKEKMPWINLGNPANYQDIVTVYNLKGIPDMYLLDRRGNILLNSLGKYFLVEERVNQLFRE